MKTRQRITKAVVEHDNRSFTVTFQTDGVHIRELYSRDEKIIPLKELVSGSPAVALKANQDLAEGSPGEALDIAACDLVLLSKDLKRPRTDLECVRKSVSQALKIIRSLEVLA